MVATEMKKLSDFRLKLIKLLGTLLQKKFVIREISATEVLIKLLDHFYKVTSGRNLAPGQVL